MSRSKRALHTGARRGVAALLTALVAAGLAATPVFAAAPVANDQSASVRESKDLEVFLDASDDDFDPLSFVITNAPDHGTLTDCSGGFCSYTPTSGYVGPDSFQWHANDGTSDSNTATFSIDVTANVAPVAINGTAIVFVDTPTELYFDGSDDDGDDLTLIVVSGPTHGDLTDCSGLLCTYTPDASFSGTDTITWKANDGLADSNTATLTITVRAPQCAIAPGVCIDQGVIRLGINPEGHLNVDGEIASSGGTLPVGLRYLPTGAEATAPGCLCEGWGAADATSGVTGYADVSVDGVVGMTLDSFSSTASTALSKVDIGTTLQVTHDFHPSVNPNLYEVEVTIKNISAAAVDARYRRVMDWDIEPTAFSEFVTIETGGSTALLFDSDDGFASADPLAGPSSIDFTGEAVDNGPDDHGSLFDFGLGSLDPGESTTFRIYYGAAGTEAGALAAITQVHGEVWSLGQPSTPDGPTLGTPNTFIFAFAGVGGTPQNTPPVAVDDATSTPFQTAVGIDVVANDTDADGDTLVVTSVTDPAHGTATINPDGTVTYTPDSGFSGTDTFEYTISDGHGGTDTGTVTVTVGSATNPAPTVDAGGPYSGTEGSAISLDGTVTNEPGTDTVSQTWSYTLGAGTDAGMTCAFGTASAVDTTITCTDDGSVTVKLTASDGVNPPVEDTATLTIANANPSVTIVSPSDGASFGVGATVNLAATFSDAGSIDSLTCSIDWGDGTVTAGVIALGNCSGSHAYSAIGAPAIVVTVTDDDGGFGTAEILLTVSTATTKVTGGGWISAGGLRVRFGFVAQPGDPAQGEFQLRWGRHRFHGTTVTSLIGDSPTVSWSGGGRYDGTDGYTYSIVVVDNGNGSGRKKTPDTIAIEIRDASGTLVYSASGSLGGGNIKIH